MNIPMSGEILVVEDNVADLRFISEVLTEAGYLVRPASDGTLALRSLKAKLPDLVLLDVNLPDMRGIDVCQKLKSDPDTVHIPVIFLSASDECDIKVQALDAGGTDYVTKPIQVLELLARIKTHLKLSQLQKDILEQSENLRKEVEQRKQSEILNTRFSQMLEDSINEIYAFDSESYRIVHANYGGRKNLGYSCEEMTRMTVLDFKIDYSFESFSKLVEPLRNGTKESLVFQTLHYRKDKSTYPVEVHLQLMPENPPLFVAIIMDITKRQQQEQNLRESEQRFRTACEIADYCILIWDRDYNYLYANQASIDHVGTTADRVIGKNIRDGLGHIPDFMQLWMDRIDEVFATGTTIHFQDKSEMMGELIYTDSTLSPLCNANGNVTSVFLVYHNVTEMKKVENDLRDSHEVINTSPAIAFLWRNEENWPVDFVSDNVLTLLGYNGDDFLSGKVQYAHLVHPNDLARVVEEVTHYSSDSECMEFVHKPYRLIKASGEVVWVDDRTTLRRDAEGNITHFQGIVLDVTAQVEAEIDRKYLETKLYQSDKMASIGQLAAGVAHEVNNPTGFILSNLKTMGEFLQELKQHSANHDSVDTNQDVADLFDDFQEAVDESLDGAKRVKKIVADMMGISRPGSDKREYSCLNDGLESTLNIVWNQMKDSCEVEKEFNSIPLVECYISKINQVFLNLLMNASHAVKNKSGKIWIKTWTKEDKVFVSIKDNGCGIPKENLSQIFDVFFTSKDVGQGTGLGLSLSYDIVQEHGGTISVESELGKGTEFVISLPIVVVAAQEEMLTS